MKKILAIISLFLNSTLSFAVCNEDTSSDYREDIKYYKWGDRVERMACKEPYFNKMGIKIRICEDIEVSFFNGGSCFVLREYYQEAYDERYGNFNKYAVPIFNKKGRQIATYNPYVHPFKYGDIGSLVCIPSGIEVLHIKNCKENR